MDNFDLRKYLIENKTTINSRLLAEISIEDLETQFVSTGKVDSKTFKEAVSAAAGKTVYATWLVKKVADGLIKPEDVYKYKKYLSVFDRQKKRYPISDINQYKTAEDLRTFLKTTLDITQEEKQDPSKQKGVSKEDKYKQFYIGSVDGFNVYKIPKGNKGLYGASCELGTGTEWCTATGKTREHYDDYISQGPLYIFIKPGSSEKYQFHYESGQFMDKNDNPVI